MLKELHGINNLNMHLLEEHSGLGSGYPFTRIPEIPEILVGYRVQKIVPVDPYPGTGTGRVRVYESTGTSLKPVQIPETPDLPEIETVLNICECVKRNCVKNEISRYNCKENRVFPSSFFPKDPIISKVLIHM